MDDPPDERVIYRERFQGVHFDFRGKSIFSRYDRVERSISSEQTRVRNCIICNSWLVNRKHVGALLLTTPAVIKANSVGTAAICASCWDDDLPAQALERACETVLQALIPNGRFEPHQGTRR